MTSPATVPASGLVRGDRWIHAHPHQVDIICAAALAVIAVGWVAAKMWTRHIRRRQDAREWLRAPVERILSHDVRIKKSTLKGGRAVFMLLAYKGAAKTGPNTERDIRAALDDRITGPYSFRMWHKWGHGYIEIKVAAPPKTVIEDRGQTARALTVAQHHLGGDARISDVRIGLDGKFERFRIDHTSQKDSVPTFRAEVDAAIESKLGQRLQSQWETDQDWVVWRAVAELPTLVPHPPITAASGTHEIPFAVDATGGAVVWDLDSDTPHCLVAGATGSGKSSTLLTILTEAAWFADIRVCDYKRISLLGLKGWPGVTRMALDLDDIADLLISAERDMMDRVAAIERGDVDEDDLQPIIVVMEEGTATITKLEDAYRQGGGKGVAPAKIAFTNLVLLGRQPHINLLVAAQRPDAKIIDGMVRDQFGCRVLLGRPKRGTHTMMELDKWVTTGPRGRGVADTGKGAREIQGWKTPDPAKYRKLGPADRAIIDGLMPSGSRERSQHPVNPASPPAPPPPPPPVEPVATILPFVPKVVREPEPGDRFCTACKDDHPETEFGNSGSRCRASEAKRVAAARARKRVPAGTEKGP